MRGNKPRKNGLGLGLCDSCDQAPFTAARVGSMHILRTRSRDRAPIAQRGEAYEQLNESLARVTTEAKKKLKRELKLSVFLSSCNFLKTR